MTRHTGDKTSDEIGIQVMSHKISLKILLTRGGDVGWVAGPSPTKPRGKLRFLRVVLDPAQFAAECRSHVSARHEGGEEAVRQAGS